MKIEHYGIVDIQFRKLTPTNDVYFAYDPYGEAIFRLHEEDYYEAMWR